MDEQPQSDGTVPAEDPSVVELRKTLTPLPMTEDELADWRSRIDASLKRTTEREREWDILAKEYDPVVSEGADAGDVKSNTHFRNTHTKMGQLFVRSPKVILTPKGPATSMQTMVGPDGMPHTVSPADAVATRQAVLNQFLGPDEIDALRLMGECLLDMQSYSGFAAVLCEYRATSRTVQQPVMMPDPMHQSNPMSITPQPAPMIPQMDPMTGQPVTQPVPVIIHEQWDATRLHPKKVLFDELLRSANHRKASRWIGRRGTMSRKIAMRNYGLTMEEVEQGAAPEDDRVFVYDKDKSGSNSATKDLVWFTEVWYKAHHFTDVDHPEQIHHLMLFDCVQDRPVVHEPYKHQDFDEQGQLTPNSLRGFPIKVGSLRDAVDSPFPKSDSAFTNALVKQLNTFIQQSVKLRDIAIGKYFYDTEAIDPASLQTIMNGDVGAMIGLKSGALAQGSDKIFYTTAQVKGTQDDWRSIGLLKSYMDETLGISATQAGAMTDTVRSATEINASGAASAGRQQTEQARVVAFFVEIARAIDMLIWRYATGNRWVSWTGPTGAQKLTMWNKALVSGEFTYDIEPDSQLSIDAARDRQQKVSAYNVMGKDPLFKRQVALRDIARLCGWDPTETVMDDMTANAQMAAQAAGIPVGQPPHGGGPINKHAQEQSGGSQNAPGQPGNNRQERNPPPLGQSPRPTP